MNLLIFSRLGIPSAFLHRNLQDWLPGVAGIQPRLGPVLGGRLTKGGLHQPPFYFACIWTFFYLLDELSLRLVLARVLILPSIDIAKSRQVLGSTDTLGLTTLH